MKRVYIVLLLNICALLLYGQHKIGVNLGGMITSQLDNVDITTAKLGYGGGIGAVYQLQNGNFLFQTGVNVDYSLLFQIVDSISLSKDMVDYDGIEYTHNSIFCDRIDRADVIELSLPLMFGFRYSAFYALFGTKFVYPLSAQTFQSSVLTTYADYKGLFYEDFGNMPQHGYVNAQPIQSKGKIDFSYDARVCVELGGVLNLSQSSKGKATELALGIFAEYGVLDVLKKGGAELINIDYLQPLNSKMNHIYSTQLSSNAFVNNLRIGLRIALLLPMTDDVGGRKNKDCMCIDRIYRKHPAYRKRR
jgi:hypothetical protein